MPAPLNHKTVLDIARQFHVILEGSRATVRLDQARRLAERLMDLATQHEEASQIFALRSALNFPNRRTTQVVLALMSNAGTVLSSADLARIVGTHSSNAIKVYIFTARNVLEEHGLSGFINTDWGRGYWIAPPQADQLQRMCEV